MSILNKTDLIGTQLAAKTMSVDAPELGKDVQVLIAVLSGAEAEEYEELVQNRMANGKLEQSKGLRVQLLKRCLVNEDGTRMFGPTDDASFIAKMPFPVLDRLFDAAMEFNGFTKKTDEELAKNLNGNPS